MNSDGEWQTGSPTPDKDHTRTAKEGKNIIFLRLTRERPEKAEPLFRVRLSETKIAFPNGVVKYTTC